MLQFDAETTRLLDIAYSGADITRRRRASFDAVAPEPRETILDIGCGNGLLTAELARAVGPEGKVIGIDPSAEMRAAAAVKCDEFGWVDLVEGSADALPLANGIADKAVSVQVMEYVAEIEGSLFEAFRVLRPGGLLVISDLHFDSLVWYSDHSELMAKMQASWDAHFVHRDLPARLSALMRQAGFEVEGVGTLTTTDHVLKPDGLAAMMIVLMHRFAIDKGHLDAAEADAWRDEQHALAKAGRFFFSLSQFVTSARKPG